VERKMKALNSYEVFDYLNKVVTIVKARNHEEAAEKAVEKWNSADDISLDSGASLVTILRCRATFKRV
jgi:BRCT domain type II-containing protein